MKAACRKNLRSDEKNGAAAFRLPRSLQKKKEGEAVQKESQRSRSAQKAKETERTEPADRYGGWVADEANRLKGLAQALLLWYDRSARVLPWRSDPTPYRVLVSELMLQQTRVEAVIEAFTRFVTELPDFAALAAADEQTVLKLWQGLGYYSRAKNLHRAARAVAEIYGGELPADYAALRTLPGIGDYTAGAVASIAFGLPHAAVDGNVLRVLARLCCDRGEVSSPAARKKAAARVEALMERGATVCRPTGRPLCESCPVRALCLAEKAGCQQELPVKRPAKPRRVERKTVLLLFCGGRLALQKRGDRGLLAGLYEPLTLEGRRERAEVFAALTALGADLEGAAFTPLGEAAHLFTHVEWRMTGWRVELKTEKGLGDNLVFTTKEERKSGYPIASAYRAYLERAEEGEEAPAT